jgi:hypothetical protein
MNHLHSLLLTTLIVGSLASAAAAEGEEVLAVLDTGIDAKHPAFSNRLVPGKDTVFPGDDDPSDERGDSHGTHAAGLTIGFGRRVSPHEARLGARIRILPVRVADAIGAVAPRDFRKGAAFAIKSGARVLNASLIFDKSEAHLLHKTFQDLARSDVLVVVPAGNQGQSLDDHPLYPALWKLPNVIVVAGFNPLTGDLWTGSNWSKTLVHIGAPAQRIAGPAIGGGTTYLTGTSQAAPQVAYAAALLRVAHPTWNAARIKATLLQRARPVPSLNAKVSCSGVLDIELALDIASLGSTPQPELDALAQVELAQAELQRLPPRDQARRITSKRDSLRWLLRANLGESRVFRAELAAEIVSPDLAEADFDVLAAAIALDPEILWSRDAALVEKIADMAREAIHLSPAERAKREAAAKKAAEEKAKQEAAAKKAAEEKAKQEAANQAPGVKHYVLQGRLSDGRSVRGTVIVTPKGNAVEVRLALRSEDAALSWTATGYMFDDRVITRGRFSTAVGLSGKLSGVESGSSLRGEHRIEQGVVRGQWTVKGAPLLSDTWRPDVKTPLLLRAQPEVLRVGQDQELALKGRSLDALGTVEPGDVDLGPGIDVQRVVSSGPSELVLRVNVAPGALPGRRSVQVGKHGAPDVLVVASRDVRRARLAAIVDRRGRALATASPHDFRGHGGVTVRVLGATKLSGLRLEVRHTAGDTVPGLREAFYARELPAAPRVATLRLRAGETLGLALAEFDGRDESSAQRLLLAGHYELVLRSATHELDRIRFVVSPPRALVIHPTAPTDFNHAGMPDMDLKGVLGQLAVLGAPHFRQLRSQTHSARDVQDALQTKVGTLLYAGHSWYSRIWFYHNRADAKTVDGHASYLSAGYQSSAVKSEGVLLPTQGKPFKDVFLAVLFGCGTGGAGPDGDPNNDPQRNLSRRLMDLGVDVVIGFSDEIPAWGAPYAFLLRFYAETAKGVDIEKAARIAAKACDSYCDYYKKRPMTETLRVFVAPNVRRPGVPLTLLPARHGNSRN